MNVAAPRTNEESLQFVCDEAQRLVPDYEPKTWLEDEVRKIASIHVSVLDMLDVEKIKEAYPECFEDKLHHDLFELIKHHRSEAANHTATAEMLSRAYLTLNNWE